jgi:hypothetical protein
MNKGFFQYLAWLTIGYVLLALASWCDDTWAAQPKHSRPLADLYVQATTDAVDSYLDEQGIPKDPGLRIKITLVVLREVYMRGTPSARACEELQKYTRKPCTVAFGEFWKVYHKLEEE